MAKTLQHRRGTTAELASVTGAIGEIFMDTTKNTLVVMDGSTTGGHPLAIEGGGGSANTGDYTFTNNVISVPSATDVVFNTTGSNDHTFTFDALVTGSTPPYSMYVVSGGSHYISVSSTVINVNYTAAKDFFSQLAVGTALNVTTDEGGAFTVTFEGYTNVDSTEFRLAIPSGSTTGFFTVRSIVVTLTGSNTFTLGSDGALATDTLIANSSALIGEVAVVANTITGIDIYGNPGTLIIEGNVEGDSVAAGTFYSSEWDNGVIQANDDQSAYIYITKSTGFTSDFYNFLTSISPGGTITLTGPSGTKVVTVQKDDLIIGNTTFNRWNYVGQSYVILFLVETTSALDIPQYQSFTFTSMSYQAPKLQIVGDLEVTGQIKNSVMLYSVGSYAFLGSTQTLPGPGGCLVSTPASPKLYPVSYSVDNGTATYHSGNQPVYGTWMNVGYGVSGSGYSGSVRHCSLWCRTA